MSGSMWLIVNVGWEYNDNYYYKTERNTPNCLFTDRVIAENFIVEMELNELKTEGFSILSSLECCMIDDLSEEEKRDFHGKLKRLDIEMSPYSFVEFNRDITKYSDDELLEIMEIFNFNFYELIEVKITA